MMNSKNINIDGEYLKITFIDVGWGDSIYIETKNNKGRIFRGLIDSNDSTDNNSTYIYLKKYFEKNGYDISIGKPFFDFIILSHDHTDHAKGLKNIMRKFGTKYFWYSEPYIQTNLINLMHYCNRTKITHKCINSSKKIHSMGNLNVKIIWPDKDDVNRNENNNSIVLELSFVNYKIYLTGDAEVDVWSKIIQRINPNSALFKVPHHGSINGTFDLNQTNAPWFNICSTATLIISCHIRPFGHPDTKVINLFNSKSRNFYRTDDNHHITFLTNGHIHNFKYSHIK